MPARAARNSRSSGDRSRTATPLDGKMLLTKAEQVSDDGRASLYERLRGLIIEPELAELSADLGRHLGEAGTFRDLSAIQAWGRVATQCASRRERWGLASALASDLDGAAGLWWRCCVPRPQAKKRSGPVVAARQGRSPRLDSKPLRVSRCTQRADKAQQPVWDRTQWVSTE
jgi:hypothetical protein